MNAPSSRYAYYRAALEGQHLPAAFVDLDVFDANLERLARRAGPLPIRLASKSVRSVALMKRALARPPFLNGLLCYSAGEAAWLATQGFDDLVVAYPTVERDDLEAVARQIGEGRRITLMVDGAGQLDPIDAAGAAAGVVMPVAIDLDLSSDFPGLHFGVYRSPVKDAESALALAHAIARHKYLTLDGLMGYEGQIAGLADAVPGQRLKNAIIRTLKRRSITEVRQRRTRVVAALRDAGFSLRFVNGGGTGSFETTRDEPSVTELAAGSGLYLPTLFDHYEVFRAEPAAGFALPVVRLPGEGIATCSGGGYIASGPAGPSRLPQPWLPEGSSLFANEGTGEVQTPVRLPADVKIGIGEPLFFRHAKAGELCERFNELLLIQAGRVVERVTTYRGDGKCFF
ncbi:MAG: amino acid deaminase/aldolase [Alphaproteobacteria bacterium]|nr:amino acid deaminase/aldolase [Alphaproteobacteria bacterium]